MSRIVIRYDVDKDFEDAVLESDKPAEIVEFVVSHLVNFDLDEEVTVEVDGEIVWRPFDEAARAHAENITASEQRG
jgi:hypothetical protein